MKNLTTLITVLFLTATANSQSLEWAKQIGGNGTDEGHSSTVDKNGNVYSIGSFENTVDFDPGASLHNLTSIGSSDVFIQKNNSSGQFIWAISFGSSSWEIGSSIAVDDDENVYATGQFNGLTDFDPGTGTSFMTPAGSGDIFVVKLNPTGTLAWAKQMGGDVGDAGLSIAVDSAKNVYTTGYFDGTADFDPGAATHKLTSEGSGDCFVSKLNASGEFIWVKQIGSSESDAGKSIFFDKSSKQVYTLGHFSKTIDFDPGVGTTDLTSVGGYDIFMQVLTNAGKFVWATQTGGSDYDYGEDIVVDDVTGTVYTTGYFGSTVDFDPGAAKSKITAFGIFDVYIQALSQNGTFLWAKHMGAPMGPDNGTNYGTSITLDNDGVLITGSFQGTVDFDPGTGKHDLVSAGDQDIFIQKLTTAGEFDWAERIGGLDYEQGKSISIDAQNNIIVGGEFYDSPTFKLGSDSVKFTNTGWSDAFICKIKHPCSVDNRVILSDYSLTANLAGASYKWLDCNNNFAAISGQTNQSFTPTISGSYALEIVFNSCIDTSTCTTIDITSGINNAYTNKLLLYPNPTSGLLSFKTEQQIDQIQVFSLEGREIAVFSNTNNITISDLAKGGYTAKITIGANVFYRKFIKE